ncbi:MAG: DMT family protein [Planctomycetota bacterium]|jgi:uncharacterized protein (DUF486 family)
MRRYLVPFMLIGSSSIMALAWLGHLRFKEQLTFVTASALAWLLVLPEYALNISALRMGIRFWTGGQMAAFRLCAGVVCVALVARVVLGETLTATKIAGFGLMFVAIVLIGSVRREDPDAFEEAP